MQSTARNPMNPLAELGADLDLAEEWFDRDIRTAGDPISDKQLRYSLCNKLAADWQKFVHASAASASVTAPYWGNCWPNQVRHAYAGAGHPDPFLRVDAALLSVFDELNPIRNSIDHGGEPTPPTDADFVSWIDSVRRIARAFG